MAFRDDMLEDQHLLKQLRAADPDALQRIYEKYLDDLLAIAVSLLSDVHAAEDCLHDVFVRLVSDTKGIKVRFNLKGYLICCVANRARDYLSQRARKPEGLSVESGNHVEMNNPVARLIEDEEATELFKAIAQLPYEQREIFVLHVRGSMKFPRIADFLGISVNTARSRYRYAIEKLQTLLQRKNDYEI